MSKNPTPEALFEGLTIKCEASVIDKTYYGPVSQSGNEFGPYVEDVAAFSAAKKQEEMGSSAKAPPTTASVIMYKIPVAELGDKANLPKLREVRDDLMATFVVQNRNISMFHSKLNSLLAKYGGKRSSTQLTVEQGEELKDQMKPFNVGKVIKIRILSHIYVPNVMSGPGWNKVRQGGSSKNRTLYTIYLPYDEKLDISAVANDIKDRFVNHKVDHEIVTERVGPIIERSADNKYTVKPGKPMRLITQFGEDGVASQVPIDEIRNPNTDKKGRRIDPKGAFAKKT